MNGTEYEVELEGEGTQWKATVGGQTFDIEMPEAAVAAKPRRSGGRKRRNPERFPPTSRQGGRLKVEEGQEVSEGQVILILEAMKMQNEIQAPVSGTVVSVQCSEGEAIEANVPLVVIEPAVTEDEA